MLICCFLLLSDYTTLPTNKQHWLHQGDLECILHHCKSIGWPEATQISECSLTPIPNAMPSYCMSLPLCNCSRWVCTLHSAVRDRIWIFRAVLLHTQHSKAKQSKANLPKKIMLIVAFAQRRWEANSCQRAHCAGRWPMLHTHVVPSTRDPSLCVMIDGASAP